MDEKINLVTYVGKTTNWSPTDGNPFDYSSREDEKFEMPEIEMTAWKKGDNWESELPPIIDTLKYNLHLKTIFEVIKFPYQVQILQSNEEKSWEKETHVDGIEIIQEGDQCYPKRISEVKPITVYIDYPFEKIAKVGINPYDSDGKQMSLGYIIWQTTLAYAEIYKNRWKEYGVWGHAFEDLYFERMEIRENNVVTFFVGS